MPADGTSVSERPHHEPKTNWPEVWRDSEKNKSGGPRFTRGKSLSGSPPPFYAPSIYATQNAGREEELGAANLLAAAGEFAVGVVIATVALPALGTFGIISLSMSLGYQAGAVLVSVDEQTARQYESYGPVFDPVGLLAYGAFRTLGASEDEALEVAGIAGIYNLFLAAEDVSKARKQLAALSKASASLRSRVRPVVEGLGALYGGKESVDPLFSLGKNDGLPPVPSKSATQRGLRPSYRPGLP